MMRQDSTPCGSGVDFAGMSASTHFIGKWLHILVSFLLEIAGLAVVTKAAGGNSMRPTVGNGHHALVIEALGQ